MKYLCLATGYKITGELNATDDYSSSMSNDSLTVPPKNPAETLSDKTNSKFRTTLSTQQKMALITIFS